MNFNFTSAVEGATVGFVVVLFILIISLIVVPIIRRNSATGTNGTKTDAQSGAQQQTSTTTAAASKTNKNYYRYQPDVQKIAVRNDEQLRIVNEYFIIKNKVTTKKNTKFIALGLVMLIGGGLAFIAGLAQMITMFTVFGAVGMVVGIVLLSAYKATMRVTSAPDRVMTDDEYDALVNKRVEALDVVSLAFTRLGILRTDIVGEPIVSVTQVREKTSLVNYSYDARKLRTSTVCASVILRTREKLYVYKRQFDMCCNDRSERASEICFSDICDVSLNTERSVATALNYVFDYTETSLVICTAGSNIVVPLDVDTDRWEVAASVRNAVRDGQSLLDFVQEKTSVSGKRGR